MKIVIFGAAGRTGLLLVQLALDEGHYVTAAARCPDSVTVEGRNLRKVRGDLFDPVAVAEAIAGQECILVAVAPGKALRPTTIFSTSIKNILAGAKLAGIKRIVVLGTCGVDGETLTRFHTKLLAGFIVQPLLFGLYVDAARMEGILEASDCEWTVIRPPRLTNGPATETYRTGVGRHLPNMASISRADVADAMLKLIDDRTSHRRWVEVTGEAWI
jgi:putative NADH-flavin reductase